MSLFRIVLSGLPIALTLLAAPAANACSCGKDEAAAKPSCGCGGQCACDTEHGSCSCGGQCNCAGEDAKQACGCAGEEGKQGCDCADGACGCADGACGCGH